MYCRVWPAKALWWGVHSLYQLSVAEMKRGETRVMMKCIGEEEGNRLPRQTHRLTHDYHRDLVNVHGDSHSCRLVNDKAHCMFDRRIECHAFRLKEVSFVLPWQTRTFTVLVHGDSHSCRLGNGKSSLAFDQPMECSVFRLHSCVALAN